MIRPKLRILLRKTSRLLSPVKHLSRTKAVLHPLIPMSLRPLLLKGPLALKTRTTTRHLKAPPRIRPKTTRRNPRAKPRYTIDAFQAGANLRRLFAISVESIVATWKAVEEDISGL